MNCSYSMSAAPDTAPRGSRRSGVSSWQSSRTRKMQEACLEWCLQRLRCLHTRCGSRRRKSQQRPPYGPKGVTLSSMQGAHQLSTQLAAKSHARDRLKHACVYRAPFWYVFSVSLFLDQASPRPTPLSRLSSSACNHNNVRVSKAYGHQSIHAQTSLKATFALSSVDGRTATSCD